MSDGTYQRILIEARNIAGGESELALLLHKPQRKVVNWLMGIEPIPVAVFLQALDMIIKSQKRHVQNTKRFLRRMRIRRRIGL
jgi:hypothetical protein